MNWIDTLLGEYPFIKEVKAVSDRYYRLQAWYGYTPGQARKEVINEFRNEYN